MVVLNLLLPGAPRLTIPPVPPGPQQPPGPPPPAPPMPVPEPPPAPEPPDQPPTRAAKHRPDARAGNLQHS